MKKLFLGFLLAMCAGALAQDSRPNAASLETVKVKIDSTEFDRRMLLDKLNVNGREHNLKFELAEQEYEYRIVFDVEQETSLGGGVWGGIWVRDGTYNVSSASADVYDPKGNELFEFKRRQRVTDYGAANAVAKEIIKRMLKLRAGP